MPGRLTRRRIAVTIVAALLLTPLVVGRALNSPHFQQKILRFISAHTPWNISAKKIRFSAWESSITVTDLDVFQQKTQHHLQAGQLKITLNPWLAMVAKLGVRNLEGSTIMLDLSHGTPPGPKESKRLDWSRILLLKNLQVSRARFEDITVLLPDAKQIRTRSVGLAFVPTLLRQIRLTLNIKETEWQAGDVITASIDKVYLRGETNVSNWQNAAPYINDIAGTLKVDDAIFEDNTINYLRTKIDYKDLHIAVDKLDLLVNGHPVDGSGFLDANKQKYAATLEFPQPIEIRGARNMEKALSIGGFVQGKVHVEGEKFSVKEGHGKFDLALTQTPRKDLPTTVPIFITARGSWDKGQMTIAPSTIRIQDGIIQISGKTDLTNPGMHLPFSLQNVPLAPVFGRFNNDDLQPIAGVATGQGTIRGWGKTFVVEGTADVTNAAYTPMVTERAHVTVKATSDKLAINGDIYQHGRVSGRCDMSLTFSHQPTKGTDILNLKASLDHHDLAPTMAAFDWTGIATATYEVHGPTGHFAASGKAGITDGTFNKIPYKSLTTSVRMIPHQIVFETTTVDIPRLPTYELTQPITLKFSPGMFDFSGRPMPNTSIKGRYRYVGKVWQVDEIAVTDRQNPEWRTVISGTSTNGSLNAHVRGTADAAFLNIMRETFRDVAGPIAMDIHVQGPGANPSVTGTAALRNNSLLLRSSPYRAENLQGTLRFTGHAMFFDNVHGMIEDGTFTVAGSSSFDHYKVGNFNLRFSGKGIRYAAMSGALRLEMDTDLTWAGTPARSLIEGDMLIEDGLYAKDFNIFDQLTGSRIQRPAAPPSAGAGSTAVGLNLHIRNNGEIRVRNNAANVTFGANIRVTGTDAKPVVVGAIQTEDGILTYAGLRFTISRGIVEFRGSMENPYIEFVGERDMYSASDQNYVILLTLLGPLNNLKYDLSSSPPQDRASLISLLMTGATPEELRSRPGTSLSGGQFVAGQAGAILAGPIASRIRIDTIRLESGMTTSLLNNTVSPAASAQRLYLGKRLSERLNLGFSTDVGGSNPQQSVVAEYLLTDYLLFKGGQNSNQNFGFNFTLRFRERE